MLQKIYDNINNGKVYGRQITGVRYPYFSTCLSCDPERVYIRWQHYGSSANTNTLRDLAWILKNIFEMTPEQFVSVYECK